MFNKREKLDGLGRRSRSGKSWGRGGEYDKNMLYESLEELIKNTFMYCVYGVCVSCVYIRVCAIEIIPWDKGVKIRREASRFPNPGSPGRTLRRGVFKSHPQ